MSPVTIGIDVGGTKIAAAVIAADGAVSREITIPTPRTSAGADPGADATRSALRATLGAARADGLTVAAIGVGVPEYVTPDGHIASAEVLAWQPDAIDAVRSDIGPDIEMCVESDVRGAALAERVVGGGAELGSFLFVSIGTGISHTLCLGDQLVTGHRGEAIALGEFPVDLDAALRPEAPLTLEQQASGRAIEQHTAECRSRGSTLPTDEEIGSRAGRLAAVAVAATVGLVDPEVVILGGGLGSSSGPYTESLINEAERLMARRPDAPPIRRSDLGSRAGVVGAGLAAHRMRRANR